VSGAETVVADLQPEDGGAHFVTAPAGHASAGSIALAAAAAFAFVFAAPSAGGDTSAAADTTAFVQSVP
jgi:hypothetical protein